MEEKQKFVVLAKPGPAIILSKEAFEKAKTSKPSYNKEELYKKYGSFKNIHDKTERSL